MTGQMKEKPRPEEEKKELVLRLSKVIGQLEGVRKMIEGDRYCGDVLIQLSAVEGAIRKIETQVYKTHMMTCVKDAILRGDDSKLMESFDLLRRLK